MLLQGDKKIFGVDEQQARELAIRFVTNLLGHARLVDQHGNEIRLR
jgi:hypothetical protein